DHISVYDAVRNISSIHTRETALPHEPPVGHPVRVCGVGAEAADLVGFVVLEVALEPLHMAVALEGENVGGEAVEEHAVVADDDRAAGEILERILERGERLGVEIVGRLVEEEDVGAGLEELGEVDAVALAAGERADLLLLVATLEVEGADIGARVHLAL